MSEGILFPDYFKVQLVVPVFKIVGKKSTAKNYSPVSLLSVDSKVFEKLVNNRIVDPVQILFKLHGCVLMWKVSEDVAS